MERERRERERGGGLRAEECVEGPPGALKINALFPFRDTEICHRRRIFPAGNDPMTSSPTWRGKPAGHCSPARAISSFFSRGARNAAADGEGRC